MRMSIIFTPFFPGKQNTLFLVFCTFLFSTWLAGQHVLIPIETSQNALVLQVDKDNHLGIIYFGRKLGPGNDYGTIPRQYRQEENNAGIYNSAYTPSGSWSLVEPAIRITHGDGNTSLDLQYISHQTSKQDENVSVTTVLLKDPVYAVEVTLNYKVYAAENVMEQWTVIVNKEKKPITLNKYASSNLYFIADDYYLTHYHGTWAREMKPEETLLTAGIKVLDSKLGTRANLFQPPTFMLSFDKPSTEDEGKVLFGTLGWSGNFQIDLEMDSYHNLRLIAGINPHASEYLLKPNQEFKTPSFITTYTEHGKGEASRNLHNWARKYRLLDGEGSRLTLLNNWEATYFDFDENKLAGLFKDGKKLGVDMFLLDDGWFGNKYPRNSDRAGLGDWQENVNKLPHGIGYLVKEAKDAGLKFGIWLEPEMVNPKSELYEKHRDWVIRQPERPEYYFRNQLVLDLSNPEVQNFVYGILDTLFIKNPDLAFIKWDCNAVTFNANSAYLKRTGQLQTQLYVDYVKGLYKVLEKIRAKYPKVPMMLCSGGGGRVDYEALKYFTEFWPSDDTDPLERIFIQWESSYFFPAIATCNHITDWSSLPLKFRTDVAMMGKMGYDIVVSKLSEKDLQFSQQAVVNYRSISDVVWHGDLYRLVNPWEKPFASLMCVNENKSRAVVFSYLTGNRYMIPTVSQTPVRLKGLDPKKKYSIKEINLYPGTQSTLGADMVLSGEYLMTIGFNPDVNARRSSVIVEVVEVK
ncbi:MAG: glycoside hydrolase clan [Chitinophagaceae bacterium]|nr:glycoside hydrolase clan [Chitinophagaceae bacterium]